MLAPVQGAASASPLTGVTVPTSVTEPAALGVTELVVPQSATEQLEDEIEACLDALTRIDDDDPARAELDCRLVGLMEVEVERLGQVFEESFLVDTDEASAALERARELLGSE